jgi:hypothetical protein
MWLLRNLQQQFGYELAPHETREIEVEYSFERMSPEAQLRLRLGTGHKSEQGHFVQDSIVFERRYSVGEGNSAALDIERHFAVERRGVLEIYVWKGSLAAQQLEEIARDRSAAIEAVSEFLDVEPPRLIRLVFYPDSASKTRQTGHIGVGLALGNTIVEIYNEAVRLDPYHELAHVLTSQIGEAPAMLNEGFATYVSERLGSEALGQLGAAGYSVDAATCRALSDGAAFDIADLSALDEIGPPGSRPAVAYPQAASVVKFLVERYGVERFRELYRVAAESEGSPDTRSAVAFERTLGISTAELGEEWRTSIETRCR